MTNNALKFVKVKLIDDFSLKSDEKLNSPKKVLPLLIKELGMYDREVFAVVNLTNNLMPINVNICHVGALDHSIAHPREILKSSLLSNSACVMFIHNHPSGNYEPSEKDIETTKRLSDAYKIVGITTLDHIICSYDQERYYSMREDPRYSDFDMFGSIDLSENDRTEVIAQVEEIEMQEIKPEAFEL